ncbi:sigma-70 family RNA polymerase sigma factor [Rudanella paleaurantiibacter]|uniref:Sigma-70 family RNA polymerase sigma factor n=1 Tax=Rudanella paleaurantiibacter TaxID=2614655 RepID=A0A7J5TW29_9BACT|nr:sigma-70 family RNA polymerase sigma factor [Rudanella paleaurantiibacter]KAB7728442.1 sigma-70 family RNA polymerase sigma factor [Rudanella paleaurantiibacter]
MLQQLIEQCQLGNGFAQRRLYDQYANRLFRIGLRYVRHDADAEEVLMNAFLKIFRSLHGFVYRDDKALEAWMKRVVTNEALQFLRAKQVLPLLTEVDPDDPPVTQTDLPDAHLDAEQIYDLIRQLPPGYRTVFNLYAIDGYSHREIAEQLCISENTSKSQLSKARALLQSWLTTNGYEHESRRTS